MLIRGSCEGNIIGSTLSADVFARYVHMLRVNVKYIDPSTPHRYNRKSSVSGYSCQANNENMS